MKKKYKILVLSDLKSATSNVFNSGVSLAKMIDADLELFHVQKATDIVGQESQLSAKRSINRSYIETRNDLQKKINTYSEGCDIKMECNHAFGNVKNEIYNHIKKQNPDVIVLGKRKAKAFSIIGDSITDFVVKNYDGDIIIASDEKTLEPDKQLSLGILNDFDSSSNKELTSNLIGNTQKPIKLFKTHSPDDSKLNHPFSDKETVELVFDYGGNSMKSLSNYLAKSDVNLLCVNRVDFNKNRSSIGSKNVLNSVNVSLLIA